MAEPMAVEGDLRAREQEMGAKRPLKRKRASQAAAEWMCVEEREARVEGLRAELRGLFLYYRELSDGSVANGFGSSLSSVTACLIEESNRPLSKLVEEVYEKVRSREGLGSGATMASLKSSVLTIGQRLSYGVPNADADLLEDDTESCLWCWEARDLKLMPKPVRVVLKVRRTGRKKIHERITAISAMLSALEKSDSSPWLDVVKASERLHKVLTEADIRLLVANMMPKSGADMVEIEVKREGKFLTKQLEKNKREEEKEKRRIDRELLKEKLNNEKDLKRLQDEADKEERRREKEEAERKKHLKKQQDEAEKEQRRKEKEEAQLKKQLAIQKQASIMERFLKRTKTDSTCKNDESSSKVMSPDSLKAKRGDFLGPVTQSMDCALLQNNGSDTDDLRNSHLTSWRNLGHQIRTSGQQHWGIRRRPKTQLVKELKLTTSRDQVHYDEVNTPRLVDGMQVSDVDEKSCDTPADNALTDLQKNKKAWQLFQFDKSHRPAFYGIWPKRSQIIGPRRPLMKDPELDYDIDSDEEWEEEDPGESLSDCDKDGDELDEGCPKADDEDESEDGFFVPDGYLSENEGVEVDKEDSSMLVEHETGPSMEHAFQTEELCQWFKQQKCLRNVTEHALRKNQPLIISNLMHEKTQFMVAEDLSGAPKVEQTCLQALSMRTFPGGPPIEISLDDGVRDEDQEICLESIKGFGTPEAAMPSIADDDLPKVVSAIQSCSQGINKVVDCLQKTFPSIPRTQLRSKVREISNFADNRWQVKRDVLDKLGLSISPEKSGGGRTRSIATFFSKRCLPPTGKCINSSETSPLSSKKPGPSVQQQLQDCTYYRP